MSGAEQEGSGVPDSVPYFNRKLIFKLLGGSPLYTHSQTPVPGSPFFFFSSFSNIRGEGMVEEYGFGPAVIDPLN